jgi:hypothetical protein
MKVIDLIEKLKILPMYAEVVGSEYREEHDEYDVKYCPFTVARYYSSIDDDVGVVYVGPTYSKPN